MAEARRVALVAGGTGITGRHLLEHLLESDGWEVHSVSRRPLEDIKGSKLAEHRVDLLKGPATLTEALKAAGVSSVTHIFDCAYLTGGDPSKDCGTNLGMLRALVEGAEAAGCRLQHVFCMSGTKWYGLHFKPGGIDRLKTPHCEDDPRHIPPNFYYDQLSTDYLAGRVREGAGWSWSTLRPNPVCGYSRASYMNLVVSLGVYASICKELGLALRFPGSGAGYNVLTEVCDAQLLARAMVFTSTRPQCANRAFNVSNGDTLRWKQVWPKIAQFFGLEVAEPMHASLAEVMRDKGPVWEAIVRKHKLQAIPYEELATWPFLDIVFSQQTEFFSSVTRLRQAGFTDMCVDSGEMFLRHLARLRKAKVIP